MQVEKDELDNFDPGKEVPGFELALEWTVPDKKPVSLSHPLTLHGAKGDTYFTLHIPNPGMTTCHSVSHINI